MSMSVVLLSRVAPPRSGRLSFTFIYIPVLTFSQDICSLCGHGIHAHADYVSMVVNHYPVNQCAAYAPEGMLLSTPRRISDSFGR